MSVEAKHPNFFSPQILFNRGYGSLPVAVSGSTPATDRVSAVDDMLPVTEFVNSESGPSNLSYTFSVSRKRYRDDDDDDDAINIHSLLSFPNNIAPCFQSMQHNNRFIDQQINCLISDHAKKVAMEIEEKRLNHTRLIMAAAEERVLKKLRSKEEEIQKINKLNFALEERLKSLNVENQIWKEMAHSNDATVNALRTNLEQVLAQIRGDDDADNQQRHTVALYDEAESCCESSFVGWKINANGGGGGDRWCISCGKEDARLLFLPCRHLCVCDACGQLMGFCPLCNCTKNGSIHVIR